MRHDELPHPWCHIAGMRLLTSFFAWLALGLALPALSPGPLSDSVIRVEPEVTAEPQGEKAAKPDVRSRARNRSAVQLPVPSDEELAQLDTPRKAGVPHKIGFPRPISTLQGEDATGRKLDWETLE